MSENTMQDEPAPTLAELEEEALRSILKSIIATPDAALVAAYAHFAENYVYRKSQLKAT